MKLKTFDYIDSAINVLERNRDRFSRTAARLSAYLEGIFEGRDEVVAVTYRVKSAASLKEKIVRNELYKKYEADQLAFNANDIIGMRIECRFLDDEDKVYEFLKQYFNQTDDGKYFYNSDKSYVKLNLGAPQPELQKNGMDIYRIDGKTRSGDLNFKFELQIKSLVNSFWSEIEHKIIYKNKRFMLIDDFVQELMMSINQNLKNIDNQMHMLYSRSVDNRPEDRRKQLVHTLTAFINDVYSMLVESKAGFSVNIKEYSDSLVKYLLSYSSFVRGKAGKGTVEEIYAGTLMNIMNWMRAIEYDSIAIGEEISFKGQPMVFDTDLKRAIAEKLLGEINDDFYLNTFFHIFFSIEKGSEIEDFKSFVEYYAMYMSAGKNDMEIADIIVRIKSASPAQMILPEVMAQIRG